MQVPWQEQLELLLEPQLVRLAVAVAQAQQVSALMLLQALARPGLELAPQLAQDLVW